MIRFGYIIIGIVILFLLSGVASALERFPPPEFEGGHEFPTTTTPHPQQDIYEYIDAIVLLAALSLAAYLVLRKRSRRAVFVLMVFSLLYFGFWRKGCVCPIGATQNIVLSIFDTSYAVPVAIAVFFLLPLVFALFFGRVFCAAVCPLGAIQDLVLLRPVSVPTWLESGLRLFAYIYLAAAVLFAATGSAFLICRYDPFVAFFRLNGNLNVLIIGACLLIISVFVGRPYCRFICPYSILLRQLSRLSKWRVTITPDECVQCKLCEDSCPYGAIRRPSIHWPQTEYSRGKKRLAFLLVLLPILMLLCGWSGSGLKKVMSRMHPTVRLAERIYLEDAGIAEDTTDASLAFRATGKETEALYAEALNIRADFGLGGWFFGGFIGLIIGLKLISVSVWRQRTDYEAGRASCLACGRCFKYCPMEHARLKKAKETLI
ncbi:MAG: 4Fe-4S binding protein [Sedimentisphaerales bacterium]|nr:4Fe-4S binding protein [Sedimentisphaerales bacterium]